MQDIRKVCPDTSVLIEGVVSSAIEAGHLNPSKVIIHNAIVDELEHQANAGHETGYLGLDEIKRVRHTCEERGIPCEFQGPQPGQFEIDHAKDGAIDDMIRQLAHREGATLLTADRIQYLVAQATGIPAHFVEFDVAHREGTALDEFFTSETMSVHLKEDAKSVRKVGKPGAWQFEALDATLNRSAVQAIAKSIVEQAGARKDSYIETERRGSTIVQLGRYRTVIAKPPFASGWEITAVRPIKQLTLDEYSLSPKLTQRLATAAEGVLIAGAPGSGKSTFVQALAGFYVQQGKIVKTVEAPRDLIVPPEVTQYSLSHSSEQEIRDVLLLNRPDYTIFDEMRNTNHFQLFADLRLAGVGMVGVVHATKPVDSIQRFLGRIEMGVIPHVVDTVIFIKAGAPRKVFSIAIEVKVPSGMMEADLARPVVCISDFETEKLEYEVYTYGEQTVVVPVSEENADNPVLKLAGQAVKDYFYRFADRVEVEMIGPNKAAVYVPKDAIGAVIGSGGKNIQDIEQKLGLSIDIHDFSERKGKGKHSGAEEAGSQKKRSAQPIFTTPPVPHELSVEKKNVIIAVSRQYTGRELDFYDGAEYLLTATVNKKGEIRLAKDSAQASMLLHANKHGELRLYG